MATQQQIDALEQFVETRIRPGADRLVAARILGTNLIESWQSGYEAVAQELAAADPTQSVEPKRSGPAINQMAVLELIRFMEIVKGMVKNADTAVAAPGTPMDGIIPKDLVQKYETNYGHYMPKDD